MAPPLLQQKVRVPAANVWRAWREEIRPARKAFQPPLHCNASTHSSCDARTASKHIMHALWLPQDSSSSSYTANSSLCVCTAAVSRCLSRLASLGSPLETASRPSATPTVCSRTNSRGLLFRGSRWRGQHANSLAGQPWFFGVKDTVTSRAGIHFFNALFVR